MRTPLSNYTQELTSGGVAHDVTRGRVFLFCYECESDEVYSTIKGEALSLYT